jgi:hypothetical protein
MNIKYSERVFVALGLQHAKHMLCILSSSVAFRLYSIFPHYLMERTIFGKRGMQQNTCVLIFYANFGLSISRFKKFNEKL